MCDFICFELLVLIAWLFVILSSGFGVFQCVGVVVDVLDLGLGGLGVL